MKLLLLTFAIISFLAQTTQGGWGAKKCWNNVGRCRSTCKSNEKNHSQCPNKQKCCVHSDKMPKETSEEPDSTANKPADAGANTPAAAPAPAPAGPGADGAPAAPEGGAAAPPAEGAPADAPPAEGDAPAEPPAES